MDTLLFFFFSIVSLLKKTNQSGFEFGDTMMAGNVAGRKIQNAIAALQDLERYEAIDTSLQIKQFLAETCDLLTQMVREYFLFFVFFARYRQIFIILNLTYISFFYSFILFIFIDSCCQCNRYCCGKIINC